MRSPAIREVFPLTPKGIIESLGLLAPIFSPTAYHGHFGRMPGSVTVNGKTHETFAWEKTDKADALRSAAGT